MEVRQMRCGSIVCVIALSFFALRGEAATVRYTFSLPEVTYAGTQYSAATIVFESEGFMTNPRGPFDPDLFAMPGSTPDIGGSRLEVGAFGATDLWSFSNLDSNNADKPLGASLGFFLAVANPVDFGTHVTQSAGRYFALNGIRFPRER
jgi:hypothetical protein